MAIDKAITVSQFNTYIKQIFEAEVMLHHISVIGEISEVSLHRGVAYFSLKDEGASLPCVCFNTNIASSLKEGKNYIVVGTPNFYVKGGKLNFNVSKAEEAGEGDLFKKFVMLKESIEKEGLFAQEHKKQIPDDIKRIGVITSREGAVIEDIISITRRRNPQTDIVLFPVKVQGQNAELEIAHAIEMFSDYKDIDVIIVARGGGSLEDLMAFNTEVVARATYNCKKPLISAVGHETDITIIDFVADMRAPTPSAAAELVTVDVDVKRREAKKMILDFNQVLRNYICLLKQNVITQYEDLVSSFESYIKEKTYELSMLDIKLKKSDPLAILKMGYARITQDGRPIDSIHKVVLSSQLEIGLCDGTVIATPKEKK